MTYPSSPQSFLNVGAALIPLHSHICQSQKATKLLMGEYCGPGGHSYVFSFSKLDPLSLLEMVFFNIFYRRRKGGGGGQRNGLHE